MASLEQLTIDIHMKATEDAEKFVFETVSPYVNDQLKMKGMSTLVCLRNFVKTFW